MKKGRQISLSALFASVVARGATSCVCYQGNEAIGITTVIRASPHPVVTIISMVKRADRSFFILLSRLLYRIEIVA